MNTISIILLALVAIACAIVLRLIIRGNNHKSCCGGCNGCSGCSGCEKGRDL